MSIPTRADVFERVRNILGEVLGVDPETIQPEDSLTGDLGAQSLDEAALALAIQHTFGRALSTDVPGQLGTVKDIVNHIVAGGPEERLSA